MKDIQLKDCEHLADPVFDYVISEHICPTCGKVIEVHNTYPDTDNDI